MKQSSQIHTTEKSFNEGPSKIHDIIKVAVSAYILSVYICLYICLASSIFTDRLSNLVKMKLAGASDLGFQTLN